GAIVIDGRPSSLFKSSHILGAINIMDGDKFETWLGSIVAPKESYYLIGQDEESLNSLIGKTAKIGYELLIKGAFVYDASDGEEFDRFDKNDFKSNKEAYTIVDIRNSNDTLEDHIIDQSINIPLPELRERAKKIPNDKAKALHC